MNNFRNQFKQIAKYIFFRGYRAQALSVYSTTISEFLFQSSTYVFRYLIYLHRISLLIIHKYFECLRNAFQMQIMCAYVEKYITLMAPPNISLIDTRIHRNCWLQPSSHRLDVFSRKLCKRVIM